MEIQKQAGQSTQSVGGLVFHCSAQGCLQYNFAASSWSLDYSLRYSLHWIFERAKVWLSLGRPLSPVFMSISCGSQKGAT